MNTIAGNNIALLSVNKLCDTMQGSIDRNAAAIAKMQPDVTRLSLLNEMGMSNTEDYRRRHKGESPSE